MKKLISLSVVLACLLCLTAAAAENENKTWKEKAELSFVDVSGNSEVQTLAAKNRLSYQLSETLRLTWKVEVLSGTSDGERNAESYFSELREDLQHTERIYSYSQVSWFKDRFAGVDSRTVGSAGLGRKWLTGPAHLLAGEAGLTYTLEDLEDSGEDEYIGGRLFGEYQYHLNETASLLQSLELFADFEDSDNYRIASESAVRTALNSFLALKTSYVVKYTNLPSEGSEKTDRILGASLEVNF